MVAAVQLVVAVGLVGELVVMVPQEVSVLLAGSKSPTRLFVYWSQSAS